MVKPFPASGLSTGEFVFIARDVPPFAARRYQVRQNRDDAGADGSIPGPQALYPKRAPNDKLRVVNPGHGRDQESRLPCRGAGTHQTQSAGGVG